MVRDSVQLETAVNTISHDYLLEFTLGYDMLEMLHPELPGPGDRIVDFPEGKFDERVFPTVMDWRTNASKDRMPVNGTYFVEAVRALDMHRTPIQKQPKMLMCLVGISRRYYLGDEVYPTFHYDDDREMDLFSLIRAPNPTKMDEPAVATDSYGVPSAIEKSPLDFAHEDGASDQGTAALEMPLPEDVPANAAPGVGQDEEAVAAEPSVVRESHKRGHDGVDANAPTESLQRDYADLRPSGSSHRGKSLAAMQLCLASNVFVSEGAPANVSDLDLLSYADAPSHHPVDVAHATGSNGIAVVPQVRARGKAAKEIRGPAIACRGWVVGHGLRLAMMKCAESLEMRQAFADVVSAGVVKGMSEGLKHGVEHRQAQLTVESIEAYDPEAEAKFVAALQSLKDLKSDGVPVFVPTVVPQGLALLLVDAVTQTDLEDA
nr:hypothetical protein [Tanacetum cinerariifolium]